MITTVLLFAFALGDAALRVSTPGVMDLAGVSAFLAFLAAVAILFTAGLDLPPAPAALAIGAIGLLSFNPDWNLMASLTGMAAGIVLFHRSPLVALPAALCVLLHPAGVAFGPLLILFALLFVRERLVWSLSGLVVSIAALLLHRSEPLPFHMSWFAMAAIAAAAILFRRPAVCFGLLWFAALTFVAPGWFIAAAPGLAIAGLSLVSALPIRIPAVPANRLYYAALAVVAVAGIGLRAIHVSDPHILTPNERAYLEDAQRIHDGGIGVARVLFAEYRNDPALWAVAQPVRIGHILTLAAAMEITGTTNVGAGAALTFAASIFTLALLVWMGARFFSPWVGLIAGAFWTTSFTELWLIRGAPQDTVIGLFSLVQIWVACEIMRTRARKWLYLAFHAIGVWSTLAKQSGVVVYGLTTIFLLAFLWFRERDRKQACILAACSIGGLIVVAGSYVLLAGDAQTAWRVYMLSFISNPEAWSYNQDCCFGTHSQIPLVLFYLSPLTFAASLLGIGVIAMPGIWGSPLNAMQRLWGLLCLMGAMVFVSIFSLFNGMESVRFLTPAEGVAFLVAGIGIWAVVSIAERNSGRAEYAALVALLVAGFTIGGLRDYAVFSKAGMTQAVPELGPLLIRYVLGI